jgi:hypothetical protein
LTYSISFGALISDFFLKRHFLQIVCSRLIWHSFYNILFGFLLRDVQSFGCQFLINFKKISKNVYLLIFSYSLHNKRTDAEKKIILIWSSKNTARFQKKIRTKNPNGLKFFCPKYFFYVSGMKSTTKFRMPRELAS